MSRRRFFAPPDSFRRDQSVTLAADEAQHMRGVLRLKVGDEVFVFDGEGREYLCRIESLRRDEASLSIIEKVEPASPESTLELTLALALLKGEKFELAVQKATELGATRIVPVMTKLSDIRLRDEKDAEKRAVRWRRIALEAAKQSGRARLPTIEEPLAFDSLLENVQPGPAEWCLLFAERGGQSLAQSFEQSSTRPQSLTALVGSEGGWTDEEIQSTRSANWRIITLGGRILRAETAAIAITALLQHLFGDLK
ncbi:MAG TPA: 16S rRNA (uracil(1498)-N(3))-methyltransferase [Pyrinomonadaceae bacterium]|nr:16S rRNA (uracil(1498)-N(3))-methyltransferase [Pyrinomonadaceae bacterium]